MVDFSFVDTILMRLFEKNSFQTVSRKGTDYRIEDNPSREKEKKEEKGKRKESQSSAQNGGIEIGIGIGLETEIKDPVLNHHNFCSISIGKVIKCSHCSWPIWGYMSNPFRCTDCEIIVHDECVGEVYAECLIWLQNNAAQHLERLQTLFPNLKLDLIKETFDWSENIEMAIYHLLAEEEKREQLVLKQGQQPQNFHSWTELRQVDRTINEFSSKLEELDQSLTALSKEATKQDLDKDMGIQFLKENMECVESTLAALHKRRDLLINSLKQTGLHNFHPSNSPMSPNTNTYLRSTNLDHSNSTTPQSPPYSIKESNTPPHNLVAASLPSFHYFPQNANFTPPSPSHQHLHVSKTNVSSKSTLNTTSQLSLGLLNSSNSNNTLSNSNSNSNSSSNSQLENQKLSNKKTHETKRPVSQGFQQPKKSLDDTSLQFPQTKTESHHNIEPQTENLATETFEPFLISPFNRTFSSGNQTVNPFFQVENDSKKEKHVHPYRIVGHVDKLVGEVQRRIQNSYENGVKAETLRHDFLEELRNINDTCFESLKKPCRESYIWEKFLIEANIDYEQIASELLQKRVDYINSVLEDLTHWDASMSSSLLAGPRRYLSSDPLINSKRILISIIGKKAKEKTLIYQDLKKKAQSRCSIIEREKRLLVILKQQIDDENSIYPIDPSLLQEFKSIIKDNRTINGRWLNNAIQTIQNEDHPSPEDVMTFLNEYTMTLTSDNKVSDPWFSRVLVDHTFFSLLHHHLIANLDNYQVQEADHIFEQSIPLLRKLTPCQLNLSVKYLSKDLSAHPFLEACNILSDISFLTVPIDILMCLASVIESICQSAETLKSNLGTEDSGGLAADDILPILVFCIIHTDLIRVNLVLKFVEMYSSEAFKRGRLGYCLTTFEAALLDIVSNLGPKVLIDF